MDPTTDPHSNASAPLESVVMPRPTAAPMVLSVGIALFAAGLPFGPGFLLVGGCVLIVGLTLWIGELLPGRGHQHEEFVAPAERVRPVTGAPGSVGRLEEGMPGYRLRLPQNVHPISAGLKGGIVGGIVMPIPAVVWGLMSGHGIWYPLNLLAGMVLPGVGAMDVPALEQFHITLLVFAIVIHATLSSVLGLIYGVLLPTLPSVARPIAWGGILVPLLWTAVSYNLMAKANPLLARNVSWPWFIFPQFVFGVAAAVVVMQSRKPNFVTGLLAGFVGGVLLPLPGIAWSVSRGYGPWFPANLLAAMVVPGMEKLPSAELLQYHGNWLAAAIGIHALLSACFGVVYGFVLPRLPSIPGPLVWGGLILPLLWTPTSYGLMGIVNPVLQERVDWAWFIASQFVFGVAASIVVLRSEVIHIPPAGRGPDRLSEFVAGEGEARS